MSFLICCPVYGNTTKDVLISDYIGKKSYEDIFDEKVMESNIYVKKFIQFYKNNKKIRSGGKAISNLKILLIHHFCF